MTPPGFRPYLMLSAIGVFFFGALICASAYFPHPYRWNHDVISSLSSPRDNPRAFMIASIGLALTGALLTLFAPFLRERLGPLSPHLTSWAGRLFQLGGISLILSAIILPGHYRIFGVGRMHEHLAQVSGVAFCLALILYYAALCYLPARFAGLRLLAGLTIILPITAFAINRLALFFSYEILSRETTRGIKSFLLSSLALWEWIGAICLYFFLALIISAVPSRLKSVKDQETVGGRADETRPRT